MQFTTADLCDAFGADEIQIAQPVFRSYGGSAHAFGRIHTIRIDEDNRGLVELLKNEKGHGDVVVVDARGAHCAVVGDRLAGFARDNGWAGIIVNGYVRDTRITRTIDVGLWALGTYPRRSDKRAESERGVDVHFAGVTFRPGEYVYADHDGIVVLAHNAVSIDARKSEE